MKRNEKNAALSYAKKGNHAQLLAMIVDDPLDLTTICCRFCFVIGAIFNKN